MGLEEKNHWNLLDYVPLKFKLEATHLVPTFFFKKDIKLKIRNHVHDLANNVNTGKRNKIHELTTSKKTTFMLPSADFFFQELENFCLVLIELIPLV